MVCPQNAKEVKDETEKAKVLIQSGEPVVASIAPSFIANYDGVGIESMNDALKKLGFHSAEETAIGATIVKKEYDRLLQEEKRDVVISSCCHSVNLLIQKYFPKVLPYLADVVSPMQAHCMDIRKRIQGAKVVFIGPCVSKKDEAEHYEGYADAVLTFEELTKWLKAEGIKLRQETFSNENSRARFFPTAGGIIKTMELNAPGYSYLTVDGVDNCISALRDIENGTVHNCFIEMSACVGSCIGGPVMEKYHKSPVKDYMSVSNYAGSKDFMTEDHSYIDIRKSFELIERKAAQPTESEITDILHQMGKFKPEQELNCGTCGYDTCREKAIAIYHGKAVISMCLPFLKDKAESFSDTIVKNTTNALIVLNENLEVQQINRPAMRIMNLRYESDILGEQVIRILDPGIFIKVQKSGVGVYNHKVYLAEYNRYVEQTVIPDKESRLLICIMRDVTDEERIRERKEDIRHQTIEVADKVVDKQMRIVQEIASLLGETAAETKIALAKLKESISDE